MHRIRLISVGSMLAVAALALSACGEPQGAGDSSTSATPPTPATATVTVTATPDTSPANTSTSQPSRSNPPTDAATATDDVDDTPAGGPSPDASQGAVLGEDRAGDSLTLADFFRPDTNWTENRFDVADEPDVSGIASEVSQCEITDYGPNAVLELRLANNFEKLNFSVGQSNSSESSDSTLVVRVVGNGDQIDIQRVPFDQVQDFDLDVSDVNALQIEAFLDQGSSNACYREGPVTAVVWDAELQ